MAADHFDFVMQCQTLFGRDIDLEPFSTKLRPLLVKIIGSERIGLRQSLSHADA